MGVMTIQGRYAATAPGADTCGMARGASAVCSDNDRYHDQTAPLTTRPNGVVA